jgi:hypothetical protein
MNGAQCGEVRPRKEIAPTKVEVSELPNSTTDYRTVCLFILSYLIFKSSIDCGIPSLTAAPFGPATFPWRSARAASMSSFS